MNRFRELIKIDFGVFVLVYYLDNRIKCILLDEKWKSVEYESLTHCFWKFGIALKAVDVYIKNPSTDKNPILFCKIFPKSNNNEQGLKYIAI